jgi:hypothetical protein
MVLFLPSLELSGRLLGKYILLEDTARSDGYSTSVKRMRLQKKRSYCISQAEHLDSEAATFWGYVPKEIPQGKTAKYLGIHLDRILTWQSHIFV